MWQMFLGKFQSWKYDKLIGFWFMSGFLTWVFIYCFDRDLRSIWCQCQGCTIDWRNDDDDEELGLKNNDLIWISWFLLKPNKTLLEIITWKLMVFSRTKLTAMQYVFPWTFYVFLLAISLLIIRGMFKFAWIYEVHSICPSLYNVSDFNIYICMCPPISLGDRILPFNILFFIHIFIYFLGARDLNLCVLSTRKDRLMWTS